MSPSARPFDTPPPVRDHWVTVRIRLGDPAELKITVKAQVSSLLKELTESAGEFTFGDGREVELKGLKGSQTVYSVLWN